jgi:hypothetical protein
MNEVARIVEQLKQVHEGDLREPSATTSGEGVSVRGMPFPEPAPWQGRWECSAWRQSDGDDAAGSSTCPTEAVEPWQESDRTATRVARSARGRAGRLWRNVALL